MTKINWTIGMLMALAACESRIVYLGGVDASSPTATGPGIDGATGPDLDGGGTPSSSDDASDSGGPTTSGVDEAALIENLTYSQQTQLCQWLVETSPYAKDPAPCELQDSGLALCSSKGCAAEGPAIFLLYPDPATCIANPSVPTCVRRSPPPRLLYEPSRARLA